MSNIDLEKFQVRTDLAFEAIDLKKIEHSDDVVNDEQRVNDITIKRTIINEKISSKVGKKPGFYYCLDTTDIKTHDHDHLQELEDVLSFVIKDVLEIEGISNRQRGLIVGLGNINVTPDSLGPLVVDNVIVTRHMFILDPSKVSEGISNVSAISPGVMGNTGIETYDIIESVIKKIQVDYCIVIDALASKSISRVNKTIQITNTGISPGSGVGNRRKEISKSTVGIPVIAIGVPTVVDAVSIVSDTIDFILKYFNEKLSQSPRPSDAISFGKEDLDYDNIDLPNEKYKKHFLGEVGALDEDAKRTLLEEVLTPSGYNMMVTPKEIDLDIEDLSKVISGAIDRALHSAVHHA